MNFLCIYLGEGRGGVTYTCICMGTHSLSYRTDWWMFTKLGRDEVIMSQTLHMHLGFLARSAKRCIQGSTKIGQWEASAPKDFFQNATATNRMQPRILNWNIVIVCLRTDFTNYLQSCFLINHLLRNLNFNRSAHCTPVSDQCPFGVLGLDLRP